MTDKDSDTNVPATTIAVVGELIKAAGKNPDVKKAGGEAGKAVLTVAKAVNICLLPIAAVNYAYDKGREYFQARFGDDLAGKFADVPAEDVIDPKASIAGPLMQGLAFSHDEDALREMYLHLLASAMNKNTAGNAHPAFVEIIKQLTAEEAQVLCGALAFPEIDKEIVQVRLNLYGPGPKPSIPIPFPIGGSITLLNHLMRMGDRDTGAPIEIVKLPVMIDNWIRLGLIEVKYDSFLQDFPQHTPPVRIPSRYNWARERPEFTRAQAEVEARRQRAVTPQQKASLEGEVDIQPGILRATAFGREFVQAVKLDKIMADLIAEEKNKKAANSVPTAPT